MKRVYTLYRVSTMKQVDLVKNDIPMQKISCHEFADRQGDWQIVKEYEEKGISGSKVSAEKRDAIQDLKEAAQKKEFDVLLVFVFDRLGRIENETPFVLQWFVEHGIEVWSVNEGQQRFDNHVDNLLNYIRFWQASGESKKTSVRVRTRLEQMTEEGIYTGGSLPYGYILINKGQKNKKGQEMKDLSPDPEESETVKRIFRLVTAEGYGSHQIARMLNSEGKRTHGGAEFKSNNILRILKNEIYIGYLTNGTARSDRIEDYRIIDDDMFKQAQRFLRERSNRNELKRTIAMNNKGRTLLSGNIYCAHCGSRLASSRYNKGYMRKDGTLSHKGYCRYVCYHRSRGLNDCNGASTDNADKIDAAVMELMKNIFARISESPDEDRIKGMYEEMMKENHNKQSRLDASLQKNRKQLDLLQREIGKTLIGESEYSIDDLTSAIRAVKEKIAGEESELKELMDEEAVKKAYTESIIPEHRRIKNWGEEFELAPMATKKLIASQLFSRVEVGKGYKVRVEINMTYRQFIKEWGVETVSLVI